MNSHIHLDRALVDRCVQAAHELGYPVSPAVAACLSIAERLALELDQQA